MSGEARGGDGGDGGGGEYRLRSASGEQSSVSAAVFVCGEVRCWGSSDKVRVGNALRNR